MFHLIKHVVIAVVLITSSVAAQQPITMSQFVINLKQIPKERIAACSEGCFILTKQELFSGLLSAHEAGMAKGKRNIHQLNYHE